MSASETTSLSPPSCSPRLDSSSTTATTMVTPRSQSRPSFAITYTQPPPFMSSSSIKSPLFLDHPTSSPTIDPSASYTSRVPSVSSPTRTLSAPSNPKRFVAPAHPQSHHLHSLPPREKTTRTLILDHTAWQHARTRLAQGRCELGMRVRIKRGAQTKTQGYSGQGAFYIGGSGAGAGRTEAFASVPEVELASSEDETDDDEGRESDLEALNVLSYGTRDPTGKGEKAEMGGEDKHGDKSRTMDVNGDDGNPANSGDAALAPALAACATGIEKVLCAMLAQPPSPPPRSPSPPPYALHSSHASSQHYRAPPSTSTRITIATPPRPLPNGVRLRLALLAVVNDLFDRQPPMAEDQSESFARPHSSTSTTSSERTQEPSPSNTLTQLPPASLSQTNMLPPALVALMQISSQPFQRPPTTPSFHTLSLPSSSTAPSGATLSPTSGIHSLGTTHNGLSTSSTDGAQARKMPPPSLTKTRTNRGPDTRSSTQSTAPSGSPSHDGEQAPSTSPVTLSFSRPCRPIPTSWHGSMPRYPSASLGLTRRAAGRSRELYTTGCYATPSPPLPGIRGSYRSDVTTYVCGATSPAPPAMVYSRHKLKTLCSRHLFEMCSICASGARGPTSRIGAGLLRKTTATRAGVNICILADMIPRFLRLSALVAMELGREARGEEPEGLVDGGSPATSTVTNSLARHAQPTRAWYALMCGLLTRAVLEGYVARGWRGAEHAEVLLGVGLGIKGVGSRRGSTVFGGSATPDILADDPDELEPDEMPGIIEAGKVAFGSLVLDLGSDEVAEEYASEMEARMSEFLAIPHATPDLATHLMALSTQYPAAPVERAALRFCEAVAKWRGRPELETYKTAARTATPGTLPIHALLASPAPRRPPIARYFRLIPVTRKRAHTGTGGEEHTAKREKIEVNLGERGSKTVQDGEIAVGDTEWVGPYGL